nr:hypothetical protein [Tanacetum cinerariifolium]
MDDPNITIEEYIRLEEEKLIGVVRCITRKLLHMIRSVNDLKTNLKNNNDKVNMPSFPSSEPMVSYFNDLDYFKDFENEFPAIVYNDALTSKLDFLTELLSNANATKEHKKVSVNENTIVNAYGELYVNTASVLSAASFENSSNPTVVT